MMPACMMMFRDPAIKVFIPQKKFFLGHYQYEDRFVTIFFFFSTLSRCASLGVVVA